MENNEPKKLNDCKRLIKCKMLHFTYYCEGKKREIIPNNVF